MSASSRPLLTELCRVFNAKQSAMLCAMSHGQLAVDGYIVRPEHLERWTPEQMAGRMASLVGRHAKLYDGTSVSR